jgi:UDP-2-acetamido-3-amino-2,3-dideoxy-glucuronate N-acetyltransferase
MENIYIHPTAEVSDKAKIGAGTRIWHQAQVRENAHIGKNCIIGKSVYIDFDVNIGDRVKIQNFVSVYHGVTIEDDVFIGPSMTFTNDLYPRSFNSDYKVHPTRVGKGASLGANATIICGVTIGRYAMIGAGSVVTADVPDNALVYGNPANLVGFVCECGRKLRKEKELKESVLMKCIGCNKEIEIPKKTYQKLDTK